MTKTYDYMGSVSSDSINPVIHMRKNKSEDFVVLNLADIHFTDKGTKNHLRFITKTIMKSIINFSKPDLIMLSGDIVCNKYTKESIRSVTRFLDSFSISWAPVFGNHDDEGNCDLNYLADVMMNSAFCIFQKGVPEMGCGNYAVDITDNSGFAVETFAMLDSHHSCPNEKQISWIEGLAKGRRQVTPVMHIPLPEYQLACDEMLTGSDNWSGPGIGERGEKICCVKPGTCSFFEVAKASDNINHIFCSHDHLNNFSVVYNDIRLTYMLKTGYASGAKVSMNGGTMIKINNNGIKSISHIYCSPLGRITKEEKLL